ncbi:mannose-1-phosphate guanylyltransferase/mannose-6-phosphate isomerase [Endozoicomonas arenosclerae]|uniref:mannose-1-phosphate guanylyltransferase/mannose-6-phosphate isomerase n=1 Tax=Endozoicomonas arenosclerae TaxID=1633495 RepID=UPI00078613E6|nr:mannose-1-phosphate guanylyltransferase/mannose-6-phosphate isomerase [Endozoicomonas arenosclerae]
MFTPVILAGGSGTRLWPYSRKQYPKQFLPCLGKRSMLQQTLMRLEGLDAHPPVIICNEEHRFIVEEQLEELGMTNGSILLEPEGRNTAPALAVASLLLREENEVMVVLSADHFIKDEAAFRAAVVDAVNVSSQDYLVTFGIEPSAPETGYGYISKGDVLSSVSEEAYQVSSFVEKPDSETAKSYLESGQYYWNSGMFVFKPSLYLTELEQFRPDILSACRNAVSSAEHKWDFIRVDREAFLSCPSDSIDYAVMEKTQKSVLVPVSCGWSDVGSWSSIMELESGDQEGLTCYGDVESVNSKDCYVRSENRLVSLVGVKDLVVIETSDAVMIADKNDAQSVKDIVTALKKNDRQEALYHRHVYRPWGKYDSIDQGHRYQVKRISVKPGARLSLQKHHHRAEHWIVVKGTALVTRGSEQVLLSENESTYIPLGCTHRLENPGKVMLELIEVQSGAYLGEDDIVRFEDTYGRTDVSVEQ